MSIIFTYPLKYYNYLCGNLENIMRKGNILVVDDNKSIRETLELMLPVHFEKVITISTPNLIMSSFTKNPDIDLVLLDMNFQAGINTGNEGLYWLKEIKKFRPNTSVVLFTAYADIPLAINAVKEGAIDFIEKPWNNEKLIITLKNGVSLARNAEKIKNLRSIKKIESEMYWGNSQSMVELRKLVEKVAPTDANILITGENGTGKEMLMKEIVLHSNRSSELLVNVDMGAVTESLFESELFGHAKGAFTDAKSDRAGKFEIAEGGSLFLDEIGNLPLHLQGKLLTALQSRTIVRVGENKPRNIDVRLISATNGDLEKMVSDGLFREDLLYRINTFTITLPALRERKEDIMELSMIFLIRYAKKYSKNCEGFSSSAEKKLLDHNWPGNIRELQHTIEKAVILSGTKTISAEELLISKSSKSKSSKSFSSNMTLDQVERMVIEESLRKHEGNMSETATALGVTRQTLYNKIKKYGL